MCFFWVLLWRPLLSLSTQRFLLHESLEDVALCYIFVVLKCYSSVVVFDEPFVEFQAPSLSFIVSRLPCNMLFTKDTNKTFSVFCIGLLFGVKSISMRVPYSLIVMACNLLIWISFSSDLCDLLLHMLISCHTTKIIVFDPILYDHFHWL